VITLEEFQAAITSLLQLLPMQRPLTPAALVLAWDTFPASAKRDLTGEVLRFCVGQRLMDPAPPKELAPHLALLRYAYPLENDRPATERRLRSDLAERMAAPDHFHDPAPVRHEQTPPPERLRLPGGGRQWHPSQMTAEQHAAHLRGVAAAMQRLRDRGDTGRGWKADDSRLAQGRWWFQRCLDGFWPLQAADDGGIAGAWILANGRLADDLLQQAQSAPGLLPPAEAVVAGLSLQGVNPWR
jgi:hypothetical protein